MSFKNISDSISNIEGLENYTILETLKNFEKVITDFAKEQSGLTNLINVEFEPSSSGVTYGEGVVDYLGNLKITLADNIIIYKPCNIKINVKGSETIIVDVDEFNNCLEIHLDSDIVNKIDRSLLLPLTPPNERVFVGIDTNNSQIMIPEIEIDNKINSKILRPAITGANTIDINDSVLTTLSEYYELFKTDTLKTYRCDIGANSSNNFKNLVGQPPNSGGSTQCLISYDVNGYNYGDFDAFKVLAIDPTLTYMSIGYIYARWNNVIVFTGWTRIGE